MKIPFLRRFNAKQETIYIKKALELKTEGDGYFTEKVKKQLRKLTGSEFILPMTSCSHAMELAVKLSGITEGDEVIIPSFTFPSTANAVLMAGGIPVYAKVNPKTLNMDPRYIESLMTKRTKGIMPVHYAGASCEMDSLIMIAKENNLKIIEDAAQGIDSYYNGKHLGTIGDFGCISFHGTKNLVSGEGGALIVNNKELFLNANVFKDKGTNRKLFVENKIKRYEWVELGSSYSPSEVLMAILSAQLEESSYVRTKRIEKYNKYKNAFSDFENKHIGIPEYSNKVDHNGHIFFLKFVNSVEAKDYYNYMHEHGIDVRTHFEPLHNSIMGRKYIREDNDLKVEDNFGTCIVRLPIYPDLSEMEQDYVIEKTLEWLY